MQEAPAKKKAAGQREKKRKAASAFFKCDKCDPPIEFSEEEALVEHQNEAHGIKIDVATYLAFKARQALPDLYCKGCDEELSSLKTQEELNLHLQLKHYVCPFCDERKPYESYNETYKHITNIHPEEIKDFECE